MSGGEELLLDFPDKEAFGSHAMGAIENTRRVPRQRRAQASVNFILEAAAQVLEVDDATGFNTNAVADRAGVSIGTLYRYFPDKQSILQALALRETKAHQRAIVNVLEGGVPGLAPDRALIRAFVQAFAGRTKARRLAMTAFLAHADHGELAARFAGAEVGITDAHGRLLTQVQAFVLRRAVQGAMRAAVLEGADFLLSQEFEDELVRLSRAYLGYPAATQA